MGMRIITISHTTRKWIDLELFKKKKLQKILVYKIMDWCEQPH
jgi:hypothetical protein